MSSFHLSWWKTAEGGKIIARGRKLLEIPGVTSWLAPEPCVSPWTYFQSQWPGAAGFYCSFDPLTPLYSLSSCRPESLSPLPLSVFIFRFSGGFRFFSFSSIYSERFWCWKEESGRRGEVGLPFFSRPRLECVSSAGKPCLQYSTDLPFSVINLGLFLGWQSGFQTGWGLSGRGASLFCHRCQPGPGGCFGTSIQCMYSRGIHRLVAEDLFKLSQAK